MILVCPSGNVLLVQTTRAAQSTTSVLMTHLPNNIWSMLPLVLTVGGIHHAISSSHSVLEPCVLLAMASNVAFSLRGVSFPRILWQGQRHRHAANNFSIISVLSFLLVLPIAYYREGTICNGNNANLCAD